MLDIKPWLRPKYLQLPEEYVWSILYQIIPKNKKIEELYDRGILLGTKMLFEKYETSEIDNIFVRVPISAHLKILGKENIGSLKKIKSLDKTIDNSNLGLFNPKDLTQIMIPR